MLQERSLIMPLVWSDQEGLPKLQPKTEFGVKEQTHDRHVVVPDLHGEIEIAETIVDTYIDESDICFVFLGDVLDRRVGYKDTELGVFRTVELIKNLGERAILTIANHEFTALGALYENNDDFRMERQKLWLGSSARSGYEYNTLISYGVSDRNSKGIEDFKKVLEETEHDSVLKSATPYYETDEFIAKHAGVENEYPWEEQKAFLEATAWCMSDGDYLIEPLQWFSMDLATDSRPITVTDKVVVSGHAHVLREKGSAKNRRNRSRHRSLHDGKRIRLASQLNANYSAPAYVWQDWDGKVSQIER